MSPIEHRLREGKPAQVKQLAILRPMDGDIIHRIAILGQLNHYSESDWLLCHPLLKFFEKIIWSFSGRHRGVQMLVTGLRKNAVASVAAYAIRANEAHGR